MNNEQSPSSKEKEFVCNLGYTYCSNRMTICKSSCRNYAEVFIPQQSPTLGKEEVPPGEDSDLEKMEAIRIKRFREWSDCVPAGKIKGKDYVYNCMKDWAETKLPSPTSMNRTYTEEECKGFDQWLSENYTWFGDSWCSKYRPTINTTLQLLNEYLKQNSKP